MSPTPTLPEAAEREALRAATLIAFQRADQVAQLRDGYRLSHPGDSLGEEGH